MLNEQINKGGGSLKSPQDSYPEGPRVNIGQLSGTVHHKGAWSILCNIHRLSICTLYLLKKNKYKQINDKIIL